MTGATGHFTPGLFEFLREVEANNNREWFMPNKARYEHDVRDPVLGFIADLAPGLRGISRHLVADPKPVGGSMFRIYRDTRLSRDKRPYKSVVKMAFKHAGVPRGAADPGFFLELKPGGGWAAGGVYMADAAALTRIRDAIANDPGGWQAVRDRPEFLPMFGPPASALKNVPARYPADHPLADDLRRRDYVWHLHFPEADVCSPGFLDRYLAAGAVASPFNRFLARALALEW